MRSFITEYPQFFTATKLEWKPLFMQDEYKDIIIFSLDFLVRAGLCAIAEDYKYSSALFYKTGVDNWGFVTHYND